MFNWIKVWRIRNSNDGLLIETAESTLCWIVLSHPGGNLEYVMRFISSIPEIPVNLLEKSESRFIELKTIIKKAREEADIHQVVDSMLERQCPNIFSSLSDANTNRAIKKAAETALSKALINKPGADFNFSKEYIAENINDVSSQLRDAELMFIEQRGVISGLLNQFQLEQNLDVKGVIKSIQLGISRYNILFVLILVIGLGCDQL